MLELRLAWQFISIIEGWLMKSSHHHGASCEVWFLFLSRASSGPAPYLSRGGRPWSWCSPSSRPVPGGTAWRSSGSGRRCRCLLGTSPSGWTWGQGSTPSSQSPPVKINHVLHWRSTILPVLSMRHRKCFFKIVHGFATTSFPISGERRTLITLISATPVLSKRFRL